MEKTKNMKTQTLAVLVDNESGVLSQVSRLFSRKGYNIESLVVGTTEDDWRFSAWRLGAIHRGEALRTDCRAQSGTTGME